MSHRFEGHNLEDALQMATQELGVDRWQLTYHVLLEKRGFLGGVKRVVIEADINESAAPPPAAPPPLESYGDVPTQSRGGGAPPPRGNRGPRREANGNVAGGNTGGGGNRRDARGGGGNGGARRGGGGGGGRDGGGSRDRDRGGRGGSHRDELRVGDFEAFLGDVPEQGEESPAATLVRDWCESTIFLAKLDLVLRTEENETQIQVRLYGADAGRLLDRQGELLDAIQVLCNKALVGRKVEKEIELDCNGFKAERNEELAERARAAADRVRNGKREELLQAMTPIERRIVHIALRDDADVTTESRGDGFFKRVAILLRSEAAPKPEVPAAVEADDDAGDEPDTQPAE
jgi:predicted RNA-binding protein Jag